MAGPCIILCLHSYTFYFLLSLNGTAFISLPCMPLFTVVWSTSVPHYVINSFQLSCWLDYCSMHPAVFRLQHSSRLAKPVWQLCPACGRRLKPMLTQVRYWHVVDVYATRDGCSASEVYGGHKNWNEKSLQRYRCSSFIPLKYHFSTWSLSRLMQFSRLGVV
jgi:hypothetical protein